MTRRRLVIETRPIAIRGRTVLEADAIDQLYCVLHHSKYSVWYALEARLRTGRVVSLVREIADIERAFYLERAIEERLGIVDRPVDGEVPRRG